jgi:hypothetical protein
MTKSFDGQRDGEKVYAIIRRHPIAMRKGFYILLIFTFLGALPLLIFPENFNLFYVFLGGFAVGLIGFFYHWVGWYFSVYIITSERVRFVSQKGLFGKSVIELPLKKVQNLSFRVPGINGELFKYGTIILQTMVGDLVMDRLYDPERTYNLLQDILHKNGFEAPADDPDDERSEEENEDEIIEEE